MVYPAPGMSNRSLEYRAAPDKRSLLAFTIRRRRFPHESNSPMDLATILSGLALAPALNAILEELGDFALDKSKDAVGDKLKDLLKKDPLKQGVKKALAAFIREFEAELIGGDLTEDDLASFQPHLEVFLKVEAAASLIADQLTNNTPYTSTTVALRLATEWNNLALQRLPDSFDWTKLTRRHIRLVERIIESDQTLRDVAILRSTRTASACLPAGTNRPVEFDADGYAQAIQTRFAQLRIDVLDPNPEHSGVPLQTVFVEPRLRALSLKAMPSSDDEVGLSDSPDRWNTSSFHEVLTKSSARLTALLGHPGTGKSSSLAIVALKWASLAKIERSLSSTPLFVDLRHFAILASGHPTFDFLEYLSSGRGALWRIPGDVTRAMLTEGRAHLLLDGLDEVNSLQLRQEIAAEISRLSVAFPKLKITISSRIVGFASSSHHLSVAGFEIWIICHFSKIQMAEFIERWHHQVYGKTQEELEKKTRIQKSLEDSQSISEMATNPLLLTLMCLLNKHHELPRDRNTLFDRASSLLLEQWDLNKAQLQSAELERLNLDSRDKQIILKKVAIRMQKSGRGLSSNSISEPELETAVHKCLEDDLGHHDGKPVARRVVAQLRERNYILCLLGGDEYGFVHRCFLEFFCAWGLVDTYNNTSEAERISLQTLLDDTFTKHWGDDRWHEVLRLIVARLSPSDAERAMTQLLHLVHDSGSYEPLWLAAKCCSDIRNPAKNKKLLKIVESRLRDIVEVPQSLIYTQHQASSTEVQRLANYQLQIQAIKAISELPSIVECELWLKAMASSKRSERASNVRIASLLAYSKRTAANAELWAWLTRIADFDIGDKIWQVRQAAIRVLSERFQDNATAEYLEDLLANPHEEHELRESATQELDRRWPGRSLRE